VSVTDKIGISIGSINDCRSSTANPPSELGKGGFAITAWDNDFPVTRAKMVITWPGEASIGWGVVYPAPMTTVWAWLGNGNRTRPAAANKAPFAEAYGFTRIIVLPQTLLYALIENARVQNAGFLPCTWPTS
jgi:hypothetical protein